MTLKNDRNSEMNGGFQGEELPLSVHDTFQLNHDCSTPLEAVRDVEAKKERLKTLAAFFVFFVGGNLNFFLLTLIHDLVPRDKPLPDLAWYIVPQQYWAWQASDLLAMLVIICAALVALLHKFRWIIFRRIFLLTGILYILRAVCLAVTFLPPSFNNVDEICQPAANTTDMIQVLNRFWKYSVTFGLTSGSGGDNNQILCGDLMFSGHTMTTTMAYFVILHYTPRGAWGLRWLMTPICYLCLVCVVISGGHYTIDMLIAYWLTSHMYWTYHTVFEMDHALRKRSPLRHLWWFYAVFWFEANTPGCKIPNVLTWPLPGPQICNDKVIQLSDYLNRRDRRP